MAGDKQALNNGLDLFSENPVDRFFPSFLSKKKSVNVNTAPLVLTGWSHEILTNLKISTSI